MKNFISEKWFGLRVARQALLGAVAVVALSSQMYAQDAVQWVNPYIGTGDGKIGYGGTMPFVTPPFGMTNWTAQTRQNRLSVVSYKYEDTNIQGFMGTHQPAIWMGDYGYVTLVPQVGELATTPEARQMSVHARGRGGAAGLLLGDDDREGRQPCQDGDDGDGAVRVHAVSVSRRARRARVLVEASRPGIAGDGEGGRGDARDYRLQPGSHGPHGPGAVCAAELQGLLRGAVSPALGEGRRRTGWMELRRARGAYAEFAQAPSEYGGSVEVRVGTSFLSVEQARENLRKEIPAWDFDAVQKKLRATWNEKLDRVQRGRRDGRRAEDESTRRCITRCCIRGCSRSTGGTTRRSTTRCTTASRYTAYSIWDTFRAENSMLTLMAPERVPGMITALLQNYKEGGWMPKWPNPSYTNIMIGTHADSLVAEALVKGFKGFDKQTAWDAVYKDAMTPPDGDTTRRWLDREPHTPYEARAGLTYYKQLGFIPTDKTDEAASRTIEDSYDDWCVAQVAKALGKQKDYEFFLKRSLN